MSNKLDNNQNNHTENTDVNELKELWLGVMNEYRTLIGVDKFATDVKKHTDELQHFGTSQDYLLTKGTTF